jgi:beta-1,4-mannosyltransferase
MDGKMKPRVLIPHWLDGLNIYIEELGRAYQRAGCELIYGADNLFEVTGSADIVHLHWPEAFYRWSGWGTLQERANRFVRALDAYKEKAKIVWTVHNIFPHENVERGLDFDVFQAVADRTDLFVHHCQKSIKLLGETYTIPHDAKKLIIPHGHYLSYPAGTSRESMRKSLGIPQDAFVYLQLGAIRSYKGLDTLLAAFQKVECPKKWLLVAGNYRAVTGKGKWRDRLLIAWCRRMMPRVTLHLKSVPTGDIQSFLAAADGLVLSHSRGLNSGVAVLGMTFGKLVIGPRLGCMEAVLDSGKNILFEANSAAALVDAMEQAPHMDAEAVYRINSSVVANWSWDNMASEILSHSAVVRNVTAVHP